MNQFTCKYLFKYLPFDDLFNCLLINKNWKRFFDGVTSSDADLPKSLLYFPNIDEVHENIETIEDNISSLKRINKYHIKYNGCYLTKYTTESDIRPNIISIESQTNCLSPFNGLLGMTSLETIKIHVYFDDFDSDDSENDITSFTYFFSTLSQLSSLKKVIIYCKYYDMNIILPMISSIKCNIILIINEWYDEEEINDLLKEKQNIMICTYYNKSTTSILQLPLNSIYHITSSYFNSEQLFKKFIKDYLPKTLEIDCSSGEEFNEQSVDILKCSTIQTLLFKNIDSIPYIFSNIDNITTRIN